jgi:IS30 family transposase
VARLLKKHHARAGRLPRKGPQRANQVSRDVPMERIAWDLKEAGHFEVDLVFHSGSSTLGEYLHTLQLIDVATGWSERVAVQGRGQQAMEAAFRQVLARVPFAVKELHPDNGPEFFNAHLVRFWKEKVVGVRLSRSRPYHKNDNRFVEQKNDSLVRQYVGTLRFETAEQCQQMDELYELMWRYYNLFQPVLHLVEKTVVDGKMHRRWDQAQTPFERLKASGQLSAEQQHRLQAIYEQTNPQQLRKLIYERLTALWQSAEPPTEQVA